MQTNETFPNPRDGSNMQTGETFPNPRPLSNLKTCPVCFASIPADATACPQCGVDLAAHTAAAATEIALAEPSPRKSALPRVLAIAASLIVLCGIALSVYLFLNKDPKTTALAAVDKTTEALEKATKELGKQCGGDVLGNTEKASKSTLSADFKSTLAALAGEGEDISALLGTDNLSFDLTAASDPQSGKCALNLKDSLGFDGDVWVNGTKLTWLFPVLHKDAFVLDIDQLAKAFAESDDAGLSSSFSSIASGLDPAKARESATKLEAALKAASKSFREACMYVKGEDDTPSGGTESLKTIIATADDATCAKLLADTKAALAAYLTETQGDTAKDQVEEFNKAFDNIKLTGYESVITLKSGYQVGSKDTFTLEITSENTDWSDIDWESEPFASPAVTKTTSPCKIFFEESFADPANPLNDFTIAFEVTDETTSETVKGVVHSVNNFGSDGKLDSKNNISVTVPASSATVSVNFNVNLSWDSKKQDGDNFTLTAASEDGKINGSLTGSYVVLDNSVTCKLSHLKATAPEQSVDIDLPLDVTVSQEITDGYQGAEPPADAKDFNAIFEEYTKTYESQTMTEFEENFGAWLAETFPALYGGSDMDAPEPASRQN